MPSNIRDLSKLKPRATLDDLFKSTGPVSTETEGSLIKINLSVLQNFKNHPFNIYKKEKLQSLADSITSQGLLSPILVRPHPEGKGYEIVSGHNRVAAVKLLGWPDITSIIRDMDDDEAARSMVDSNLEQREKILHSEKARSLKMEFDAIRRQGQRSDLTSDGIRPKLRTDEIIATRHGMGSTQVKEYIKLNDLIPGLLDILDEEKMPFGVAVNISYLDRDQQCELQEIIDTEERIPSLAQAKRMRERAKDGLLDYSSIHTIMTEEKAIDYKTVVKDKRLHDILAAKPKQERENFIVDSVSFCDNLQKYFPKNMSLAQMQDANIRILEAFNRKQREKRENER